MHPARPIAIALSLVAGLAQAASPVTIDEAPIRAGLKRMAPKLVIDRIAPSPVQGVVEVTTGSRIYYVSLDGSILIHGSMLRTHDSVDLSEIRRGELRATAIDALPGEARVRYSPAAPAEDRVVVFTAVDCGYCRRFHQNIDGYLGQGIAVDYVMIPLAGPGSDADRVSRSVYCAADRQAAFTAATFGHSFDTGSCESNTEYAAGVDLARMLEIRTTPTVVAADGRILGGYLDPAQLKQRLAETIE